MSKTHQSPRGDGTAGRATA